MKANLPHQRDLQEEAESKQNQNLLANSPNYREISKEVNSPQEEAEYKQNWNLPIKSPKSNDQQTEIIDSNQSKEKN